MIDPDLVPELRADVRYRRVSDEGVVLLQQAGRVLGVNGSGVRFLELADGRRSLREIVDLLAQGTDADRATVEADVASFVARLARAGVLRSAEAEASGAP